MPEKETKKGLSVKEFFESYKERVQLELVSSEKGFDRQILEGDLHRPGLALAGFVDLFSYSKIQVCGNTEVAYMARLSNDQLEESLEKVFSFILPCIIFTNDNQPRPVFLKIAEEKGICVFKTSVPTTNTVQLIGGCLEYIFAPREFIHGTLVDVYGIGILITGRSGIGKTEVALDLVKRGHRLVADDVVTALRLAGGIVIGKGNDLLKHSMEIRGVGILDVRAVFGIRGIRRQKRIEVMVELQDWDDSKEYERLGLDERFTEILGEKIPNVQLAVYPGKTISVIIEVVALNWLLRFYGHNSAKELEDRLNRKMGCMPDFDDHYEKDLE